MTKRVFPAKNGWQDALQKLREKNAALTTENKRLREALEESVLQPQIIQQMMRKHGVVIDNHDEKMQKFALTLYTVLVNLASIAQDALQAGEEDTEPYTVFTVPHSAM